MEDAIDHNNKTFLQKGLSSKYEQIVHKYEQIVRIYEQIVQKYNVQNMNRLFVFCNKNRSLSIN